MNNKQPKPPTPIQPRKQTTTHYIKVLDFTVLNGIKFGIGFTLGYFSLIGICEFIKFLIMIALALFVDPGSGI